MSISTTLLATFLTIASASVKLDKDADGIVYSKHQAFRIPLNLSPEDRQRCSAIRLFVSQDEGKKWVRHSDGDPDMKLITFRAFKDGVYWFTLAIVDKQGNQEPADIGSVEPGLRVVVDSAAPQLTLKPVKNTAGKRGVRWEMQDEHLDLNSLRLAVSRHGQSEWDLFPLRHPERQLVWFEDDQQIQQIQAVVKDRAGNEIVQQVDIIEDRFARKSVEQFAIPGSQQMQLAQHTTAKPSMQTDPQVSEVSHTTPSPFPTPVATPNSTMPPRPQGLTGASRPQSLPTPPPSSAPEGVKPSICRTDTVVVNYALDDDQAQAVVELWGTRDQGKTWMMLAVDTDGKSPVEARLRGEGVWGLLVRVPPSPQQSGVAPESGTEPDTYIELDTQSPKVTVQPVRADRGQMQVQWNAEDKNLSEKPVSISYASSASGPWQTIAAQIPNTGNYTWNAPTAMGPLYVKVEAQDRAGNVGRGVTRSQGTGGLASQTSRSRVLGVQPTRR